MKGILSRHSLQIALRAQDWMYSKTNHFSLDPPFSLCGTWCSRHMQQASPRKRPKRGWRLPLKTFSHFLRASLLTLWFDLRYAHNAVETADLQHSLGNWR